MDLDFGVSENMSAELGDLAVWLWASYLYSESSHRIDVTIKQGNMWRAATMVPNTNRNLKMIQKDLPYPRV